MSPKKTLALEIPEKFSFLEKPMRYKCAYGGRGSAKSWTFARRGLIRAMSKRTRFLCAREIQNSIKESVHRLISEQINGLDLYRHFTITNNSIVCVNGSEFIFKGVSNDVQQIKSLENIDICWVSEAQGVSKESWDVLIPTVRNEGSEFWVDFNPDYEDDYTYQYFVANPPNNCISVEVNYYDNPWFPKVLQVEMEACKARDYGEYEHIWLGKPKGSGGRVFPSFDREAHIREFDAELIRDKGRCFMAMDPHSHYYPFCTWIAIIPKNDRKNWPEDFYKHIYAEWPTFDDLGGYYHDLRKKLYHKRSLKELAVQLLASDGSQYGFKVLKRFIDSRYAKGSGSWNWSTKTAGIVELFSKPENGGLLFECPPEKVIDAQRQSMISDMVWNRNAPLSVYNEPSFSVDPSCRNVIKSLLNHRLEEGSEKESEKFKEASDTIRINYAGIHDFKYDDAESSWDVIAPSFGKNGWMA